MSRDAGRESGSTSRDNNFDVLRLVAAGMVLCSHAWPLAGKHEPAFPGTHATLGFVGVLVFFAISGYLIAASWLADRRAEVFLWKRFLRIAPALAVSSLLTAFVLGPVVTSWPLVDYFTSLDPYHYVVANSTLLLDYSLPGVFQTNPLQTVNGSLGTLPVEVKAYAILLVVGVFFLVRRAASRALLGLLLVAVVVISLNTGVKSFVTLVELFALFAGAAALYILRDRLPWTTLAFVVSLGLWLCSYQLPKEAQIAIGAVVFPYVVVYLGHHWLRPLRPLASRGDISYGIYIFAFPVQQTVVHVFGTRSPWLVIAIAFPVTILLALASWRLVEQPALRLKGRVGARRPVAA